MKRLIVSTEHFFKLLFLRYNVLTIAQIVHMRALIEKTYLDMTIELSNDSISNVKKYYSDLFIFSKKEILLKKNKREFLKRELALKYIWEIETKVLDII